MASANQRSNYPRQGSAVSNPPVSLPPAKGTRIYNWRMKTPWGWCGGDPEDKDWTTNKAAVLAMFKECRWPCELLEDVVR